MNRYRCFGLGILSELAIDEWNHLSVPTGGSCDLDEFKTDVTVRVGSGDDAVAQIGYRHEVPEVGTFIIRDGEEVIVLPDSDADIAVVRAFLTSSVWGIVCYQRDLQILHASAVCAGDRTFAFAGHSGSGKSSIAALLQRGGYDLFVDDLSRLDVHGDGVWMYSSTPALKLWGDTLPVIGREADGLARIITKFDKYYVPFPNSPDPCPRRLDALYVLRWGEMGLRRLRGSEALQIFISSAIYRPELLKSLKKEDVIIQRAVGLVGRLPIYELSRPRDWASPGKFLAMLERHWKNDVSQAAA